MGGDGKIRVKPLLKKVFTTPVFLTYLFLVTLALLHVQLPGLVLELTGVIGNANSFLAMLSIGILFEFKLPKAGRGIIVRLLSMRFAVCIAIAAAVYFLLPLPADIKKSRFASFLLHPVPEARRCSPKTQAPMAASPPRSTPCVFPSASR